MHRLFVEVIDGKQWRVHHDWDAGWGHVVPRGFVTDFASIPCLFWRVLPPAGPWAKAAVLHDYLYRFGVVSRTQADTLFYERMKCDLVPGWQRWIIYLAVRLFGWRFYNANVHGDCGPH